MGNGWLVTEQGVLVNDAIDIIQFTSAFQFAVAQPAGLKILIPLAEPHLARYVDAATLFCHFHPLGLKQPAVEASFHIPRGHEAIQLLVVALLVGPDHHKARGRLSRWGWSRAGPLALGAGLLCRQAGPTQQTGHQDRG